MTDVDLGMSMRVAAAPASPLRLAWLFARSLLAAGICASALYAGIYVAQDMRRPAAAPAASANVEAPAGLEVLTRAATADALARLVGFQPTLPGSLPDRTAPAPRLDATQPAADGSRIAEIRYASARNAAGGALGPSLLIRESRPDAASAASDAVIIAPGTVRGVISCGGLAAEVRLFFPPSTSDAMALDSGRAFIDAFRRSCAG